MTPRVLERSEHPVSRRDIDPNVLKVLYRLLNAGHTAYIVGGGVRDLMLGRQPKDFDIATSAHPHQVRELFRNSRVIGRRFKLVHVFFGQQNIEVATFRRRADEADQDGDLLIRQDNTFGTPEEDAFRRDFTINALFYDVRTFRVIDYVGGIEDLERRTIRTIGEPQIRMREDPVRMIRAARLSARFGFAIDPATEEAIFQCRSDLEKASRARLVEETFRTLGMYGAARALILLDRFGLLPVMLPRFARSNGERIEEAVNNLAAIESGLVSNGAADRAQVLAALYLDSYLNDPGLRSPSAFREMMAELRMRGFARADTERMRLLLEAFPHLLRPGPRTLRLARRSYFGQAMEFYGAVAHNYGAESAAITRYLAREVKRDPRAEGQPARRRRRRPRRRRKTAAMSVGSGATMPCMAAKAAATDPASSE